MRIIGLIFCETGNADNNVRVLADDGKLYDIADITKDHAKLFVPIETAGDLKIGGSLDIARNERVRGNLQVDGTITTDGITTADSREINSSPEEYMNRGRRITTEFKKCSSLGLSGPETFCTLVTIVQWGDSSGGYPKQIAVSAGNMYIRTGISNTTWGNWSAVLVEGDLAGYAQLASPNNLVHRSNECTFVPSGFSGGLWFNYRTVGGTNGSLSQYNFGRGNGGGLANINVNSLVVSDKATTLSNLGAAPIGNLKRVDLWQGTCNKGGSVTVTNAYRYSVLWLVVTPGSGESEIIACEYNNRAAVRQICSNNSWIGITSSISGNNKTFTVSGGNDGCKLTKIVGAVQFQ